MKRRDFMGVIATVAGLVGASGAVRAAPLFKQDGSQRAYLVDLLLKMALPVLEAMSKGQLKKTFVLELSPRWAEGLDPRVSYLECFGRLMSGIAPWLALPDDDSAEGKARRHVRELALQSFANSVDPASPDYLAWRSTNQTLVDSAYYTNALMRAPKALWEPLDAVTRQRIIEEIKGVRRYSLPYNNWLLFAAMNEAWLFSIGEQGDVLRLNAGVRKANEWYAGDGWIKDGDAFHYDYYNSYVMWPMLLEILEQAEKASVAVFYEKPEGLLAQTLKRTQRYCEHLERMVSPEGSYPAIGRSLTYRTAAFQPLALLAWRKKLPESLPEGQVRAALHAVHKAIWTNPSNFTKEGFLTLGFAGHNPQIADVYSNSGSMYIASNGLLALGLPATDTFWTTPSLDWTQKKAFSNQPFPKDYAVNY
ncbi:DUF2264 domain-containing protein [Pseudoduganella eburnea]|uniref:DUF2264 domain-containing protein n=1 Tax=Massilia eburnea TaxID=1776165 RepID=A0A6L6QDU3_9BURK|nr:DUF2264 domain-containing protein [Massilia eburnea]MTW10375.1 DUF2264 domain-containing protein [Massilia eburnea]